MKAINIILIALVALLSLSAAQGVNHCKPRMCGRCRLKDGTKYCSSCYRSFKINSFQHSGTEGTTDPTTYSGTLGECSTVGYPEESRKCLFAYALDHATKSGCSGCENGYVANEGVALSGKTDYSCIEPAVKIENCYSYTKTEAGAIKCYKCKENFTNNPPDYLTCLPIPEASKLPNCSRYFKTTTVDYAQPYSCNCKEGYLSKYESSTLTESCVATLFKGCERENTTKTRCVECNTGDGWYAVDVSDEKGQICEFRGFVLQMITLALTICLVGVSF